MVVMECEFPTLFTNYGSCIMLPTLCYNTSYFPYGLSSWDTKPTNSTWKDDVHFPLPHSRHKIKANVSNQMDVWLGLMVKRPLQVGCNVVVEICVCM